jgi:glycosyltransferase involved in cell wall biosynthesis
VLSTEYARCGNTFPPGRSERIRMQERAGTYWADRVVCVSNAVRSEIAWMYEVPDAKMNVIPNGVAPARFQRPLDVAAVRARYNVGADDPMIVFSGRMEWQKGPDLLMEAMPAVLRAQPDAKLVYVGDGSMRPGIENRAWHLGVAHAVRFLGRRDEADIAALYQACDVVCVPSRNEPFGIVILEAWSAGKPVIVTDHGGASEIVRHEYSGLHVSPTPDSIAWGISTIFADPSRAKTMGANGREESATRYAWRAIAATTADVYAAAVAGVTQPLVPSFELAHDVARKVSAQGERKVTRQRRADGTPVRRRAARAPSPLNI